jgi:hypothetical protein
MPPASMASRLLDVIDLDVLPLTERGVAAGNKVFGAAILRKSDLSMSSPASSRSRNRCAPS